MYSFTKEQIYNGTNGPIIFKALELLYDKASELFYYLIKFQTIKETIQNKHFRISTRVSVVLIPTRRELESYDLWWSNNVYYNNRSYINMLQRKLVDDFPFITKKDLKEKIMIEFDKEY